MSGSSSEKAVARDGGAETQEQGGDGETQSVMLKVAMLGEMEVGKTSMMVKYVEGTFDQDYIQSLGVTFEEKTIKVRNTNITFVIWDVGGQHQFRGLVPIACNDAVAILFMFDLTRMHSLERVKEWFKKARKENKTAFPFLVGTKYDLFVDLPEEQRLGIIKKARKYAKAMRAALIFSSASHSINVSKIFKLVISRVFGLKTNIEPCHDVNAPLVEFDF